MLSKDAMSLAINLIAEIAGGEVAPIHGFGNDNGLDKNDPFYDKKYKTLREKTE